MKSDSFKINGATIVISKDDILLDGQHRLYAISELDIELDLIVVSNAENSVFSTIDTGRNRTAADVFGAEKIKYSSVIASACKRILEEFGSKRKTGKIGSVKYSNSEILAYYQDNKEVLDDSAEFYYQLYSKEVKIFSPSVAVAMFVLLSRENKFLAKSFVRELYTGNRESESNAALVLRKKLLNFKIDGFRVDDIKMRTFFIIAYRAYKQKRDIKMIKVVNKPSTYLFKEVQNG